MSLAHRAVGWSPAKVKYDLAVAALAVVYLVVFAASTAAVQPYATPETLLARAFGSLAFVMLTCVLLAGPLARLSPRFLTVLRNRRHLGVATFLAALAHGGLAFYQFHFLGDLDPLTSLLSDGGAAAGGGGAASGDSPAAGVSFQLLGAVGLAVLFAMAATSHDFWLAVLTPRAWKALHMLVYAAYAALAGHMALGALQEEGREYLWAMAAGAAAAVFVLHLATGARERRRDLATGLEGGGFARTDDGFVRTVAAADIPDGRARVVPLAKERVAVFRNGSVVSCVSNVCRHQMGPLGEGRIVDGCITCPWHGFQYDPVTGCAPAPFTDRLPTYDVELRDGIVWVNPVPNPLGRPARTATLPSGRGPKADPEPNPEPDPRPHRSRELPEPATEPPTP